MNLSVTTSMKLPKGSKSRITDGIEIGFVKIFYLYYRFEKQKRETRSWT